MTRSYLDVASTAPLRDEARRVIIECFASDSADPGRVYQEALASRAALEQARETLADCWGCRPRSVVLTSGATESIYTATHAAVALVRHEDSSCFVRIGCAPVEHSAVREASQAVHDGEVIALGVDDTGTIDVEHVAKVIDSLQVLHVQWVNHEVGTLQPVRELVELAHQHGVFVHVDAAQAAGWANLDFDALGADAMSISAHKLGGPVGIGALLVRRGVVLPPLFRGGAQERARRAGLESVAMAAGFAAAVQAGTAGRDNEAHRLRSLTSQLAAAATAVEGVHQVGALGDRAAPHLCCFVIDGVEAEAIVLGLDRAGIAVHSGSACSSELLEPSPVLAAMGLPDNNSLRLSVGWSTTPADVDAFANAFSGVVIALRSLR